MIIDRITFTGADDSVNPDELLTRILTLTDNTSQPIELGILLSASSTGSNRFPSLTWLDRFTLAVRKFIRMHGSLEENLISLSGHLCGGYARGFLSGSNDCKRDLPNLWNLFDRIQINTHGKPTAYDKEALIASLTDDDFRMKDYIFQMDGVNNHIFEDLVSTTHLLAFPLFDESHGTGVYPESRSWPYAAYKSPLHGYAGGIGPDNILRAIDDITQVTGEETEVWLDMETKVRSNNDQQFDLGLVTAVVEQLPLLGEAGEINEEVQQ